MLHQIGIGTLGPVFRTYEPTRDRLVAVKVFRLDIIPEQAQLLADALTRATQSSLFHPSIVEPIASGVEGTLAYRAEEYVAAESLDVAMRHYAPAPIEKALPFITQLAGAIDFARAAGVGHGGLHPRDIFVTPDEARATGFGVVEALEEVGIRAPIRRPYTAPERIAGSAWGTPADIFSLAAIAFELLTGRRPAGTGVQAGALLEGANSAALHAVLARGMDDEPARRYPSALAFASALESAGRGQSALEEARLGAAAPAAAPSPSPARAVPVAAVAAPAIVTPPPAEPTIGDLLDAADAEGAEDAEAAVTPGEFTVEEELAPVYEAREDLQHDDFALDRLDAAAAAPAAAAPMLFDDEDEPEPVVERAPDEPAYAPEEPMYAGADPEPELQEAVERPGPAILPMAVAVLLALLAGFAAGYFVGSRDRVTPSGATAAVTPPAAPATAPSGPATPEKPGQYSEQKVTTPAPVAGAGAPPAPAAPPTRDTARPAEPVPPPASAAEAARPARLAGHLVVRSTPSRASVTVNGTWRGRTPLTLDALAFGNYVVRIVQDGFNVAREEVTLSARNASQTINARLEPKARGGASLRPSPAQPAAPPPGPGPAPYRPAPAAAKPAPPPQEDGGFTGSLYVDSRPQGATVLVDGKNVGVTPITIPDIPIGSHVVRIEMAGKKPWTTSARVLAGKMERVTGSLEDK